MADNDQDQPLQPIIIVKRGGGHHDEHHGGVWKIAFADFMTAMMAFFLVMWLINAANEETRAQVASYFNPVKLTDAVAVPKGVRSTEPFTETEEHDEKNAQGGGGAKPKGNSGFADEEFEKSEAKEEAEATSERVMFQDPYAVLVEIAGEKSPSAVPTAESGSKEQGGGLTGGEAFRDPFDPAFWLRPDDGSQGEEEADSNEPDGDQAMTALVEKLPVEGEELNSGPEEMKKPTKEMAVEKMVVLEKKTVVEKKMEPDEKLSEMAAKRPEEMNKVDTGEKASSDPMVAPADGKETDPKQGDSSKEAMDDPGKVAMDDPGKVAMDDPGKVAMDDPGKVAMDDPGKVAMDDPGKVAMDDPGKVAMDDPGKEAMDDPGKEAMDDPGKAELAAAELKAEIMAATETTGLNRKPVLSVDKTQEGLVVSLTDDLDFGMFASASARPNAEMIKFMDRIAGVLAKREGRLVVRGHTDSRPFRSKAYDNWRLSTARAHMAYHMLVRGGVDTDRFARIEGYADRDPRNRSDTEAAENRRIEILLVGKES